jgi:uncharacterized delta-60 repeat protein
MKKQIFIIALIISVFSVSAQTPGGAHPAAVQNGIVITPVSTVDNEANAMAIQKDGKIVVAGYSNTDFAVVRYNTDGTLDPAFGTGGIVKTSLRCGDEHTSAIAIQPDGKIVIAGSTNNGTANDFAVIRYNENGTLDHAFGKNGIVTTSIHAGDDNASGVAIQKDGKIIVAGSSNNGSDFDFALIRYNSNGTLDPAFGKGGIVSIDIRNGDDQVSAVAIQADGKIVVAGYSNTDFALARFRENGTLDAAFGTGGKVITSIRSGEDEASAISIQPDGKIVVAGSSNNGLNFDFAIVRYNANGRLDPTFGKGGMVTTAIRDGDDKAAAVAIQADRKIVVAGSSNNGLNFDFALVRYNPNGTLDPAFGEGGIVMTDIRSGDDHANAIAIQADGKIVTAGNSNNGSNNDFAVIRYTTAGKFDPAFGTGGK